MGADLPSFAAFTCDRFASASTGWAGSLEEADITTLLPATPGFIYPVSCCSFLGSLRTSD